VELVQPKCWIRDRLIRDFDAIPVQGNRRGRIGPRRWKKGRRPPPALRMIRFL
jgi:hypothetical protein